jgi:hypothetical protein
MNRSGRAVEGAGTALNPLQGAVGGQRQSENREKVSAAEGAKGIGKDQAIFGKEKVHASEAKLSLLLAFFLQKEEKGIPQLQKKVPCGGKVG